MKLDIEIEEMAYVNVISVGETANELTEHLVDRKISGVEFMSINADSVEKDENILRSLEAASGIVVVMGTADSNFELNAMLEISKKAKLYGNLCIGVAIKRRHCKSLEYVNEPEEYVAELKKSMDTLIILPSEVAFELNPKDLERGRHLESLQKRLEEFLALLAMPVNQRFIFNIKHSDLEMVLKNKGIAYFETASASKISKAIKMIGSKLPENALDMSKYVLMGIRTPESIGLIDVAEAVDGLFDSKECCIYNVYMGCECMDQVAVSMFVTDFEESEEDNELINNRSSELEIPAFLKKK